LKTSSLIFWPTPMLLFCPCFVSSEQGHNVHSTMSFSYGSKWRLCLQIVTADFCRIYIKRWLSQYPMHCTRFSSLLEERYIFSSRNCQRAINGWGKT
jgi:hypothetical protein